LALIAASLGLFWQDGGDSFSFTTLRGYDTTLMSFDVAMLPNHFSPHLPSRNMGIYSIVSGVVLLLIWPGLSIIPALIEGKAPPEVWSYTTVITYAIDMGIVAPALIVAGVMLLHRNPLGYLLTATLLVFTVILGTSLLTAGTIQMLAGFIDIRQFIGFVASFAILTLYAIWFSLALFRNLSDGISP
jgi:hypothetical protein